MTRRGGTVGSAGVALVCAAVAVLTAGLAVGIVLGRADGRPSALVRMAAEEPLAELARGADPGFAFVPPAAHYDGVYFYAIARDPLARGEAHSRIDDAAYRYAHAGYGLLAWLASAGRPAAVPTALLALSLAGIAVAAWSASRVADALGLSAWGGLVVAFSPGLLFAATASTSENVAGALLGLALLAWLRGRTWAVGAALALLCLTKEMFVLVPAGLLVWLLARRRWDRAQLAALAAGPLLLATWFTYLRLRFGSWPLTGQDGVLAATGSGWADSLQAAADLISGSFGEMQVGAVAVPLLLATAGGLGVGAVRAAALRTPLDAIYLVFVPFAVTLGSITLLYPKELVRNLVVPLLLLPAVLVTPRRDGDQTPVP